MKECWIMQNLNGFKPYPQNNFKSARIILKVNGGGYLWFKYFPWIKLKIK